MSLGDRQECPTWEKFVEEQDGIDLSLKFGNHCLFSIQPRPKTFWTEKVMIANIKGGGQISFGCTFVAEALMHLKSLMVAQIDFR